jgi:tetratricopeptide (TPR) repeat protein
MNRVSGLILALSVGIGLSACASSGATGGGGSAVAEARGGTKPSENKSTREASRAIGLAMLRPDGEEKRALYEQALQAALASIQAEPGNPRGWFLAGQAYANLGDMVAADTAFTKAVEIYPAYADEVDGERENAWVMAYNEAVTAYQQNDMDGAIAKMEQADRIFRKRPEARLNLAAFYAQRDEMDKAIEAYRGALEILRGPVPAGVDSAGRREWEENEQMASLNLAQLLGSVGRYSEAEQVYRDFLARRPDNLNAQISLAEMLAQQGKTAEAGEAFANLLSRTDLTDTNYLMIGVGLFRAEQYEQAAEAFRKAVAKNPYTRDGHYNLAQSLYVYAGKLEEARKGAQGEEAKKIDAQLVSVHTELAASANKVLELDPGNRNILAYLARAYQSLSQLSPNAGERQSYQAKVQDVLKRHEAFVLEVDNISIQTGETQIRVNGTVKNLKVSAGQPIRLRFTILGSAGQSLGSQEVTVSAPAAEQSTSFQAVIPVTGELAGWKYEILN